MRQLLLFIAILLIVAVVAGCGGGPKVTNIDERSYLEPNLPPPLELNRRAYNYYVNGTIFELMDEMEQANLQYREALKYYPESDVLRFAYANTYFQLGQYAEAFDQAKKINERDADAWILLANCYNVLGVADSLVDAYLHVVQLDTLNLEAFYRLGVYYQGIGNYDSAIWAYQQMAHISPSFRIYNRLGNAQIQAKKIDDAEQSFLQSIELDSTEQNLASFINLSVILENKGEIEEAAEYLTKAYQFAPDDQQTAQRCLEFYQRHGMYQQAIGVAENLYQLQPDDSLLPRRIAMLYFDGKEFKKADSAFGALIDNGDSSIINFYYAGRLALIDEDLERAKEMFRTLTVLDDSIIDGWMNLGLVYRMQDSLNLEVATYEAGVKHMRNLEDTVHLLFSGAVTLEKSGYFDQSVDYFEKLIKLDPKHSQSLNYLGYMLADKGIRLKEAKELIGRALDIMPESGAYLDSYGWVLFKLGEIQEAKKYLLKAYEHINNDPVILEHIGDVYQALGNEDKAVEYWNTALQLDPENEGIKEKITE